MTIKTIKDLKNRPVWAVAQVVPPRKEGQHQGKLAVSPVALQQGRIKHLKSTTADGWTDYQTAKGALDQANPKHFGDTIKFTLCLRILPPLIFVDVDDIDDPEASKDFKELSKLTRGTYCEVSQSGRGLHFLATGELDKAHKGKRYETYQKGRYMSFTGDQVSQSDSINPVDVGALLSYCGFKAKAKKPLLVTQKATKGGHKWGDDNGLTPEAVLAKAIASPDLDSIARGDYSPKAGDHSSAVQALVNSLAFFANGDGRKTDQAYRLTPSYAQDYAKENKWNSARGDSTWGADTVAEALDFVMTNHPDHGYFPPSQKGLHVVQAGEKPQAGGFTITIDGQKRDIPFTSTFYGRDYEMTEVGFSHRFADWYAKGKLLFSPVAKDWLMYNPKTGSWMDNTNSRLGQDFDTTPEKLMDALRVNLKQEQPHWAVLGFDPDHPDKKPWGEKAYQKGYDRISTWAGVKASLALAQSQLTVRAFNDTKTELNTRHGWYDLTTGDSHPHDPAKLFDKATEDTGKATGELWARFIDETFCGDAALIEYVQELVGYSITGYTTEQVMFLCVGTGNNGKSVFLDILQRVLGDYGATLDVNSITGDHLQRDGNAPTPDLASLVGKRFVSTTEPDKQKGQKVILSEGTIKTITSGNVKLKVRLLHQNPIEYYPQFKIWYQANSLPEIDASDFAIVRRLVVIPFNNEVRGDAIDTALESKLLEERQAVLQWAIEGALKWRARQKPLIVDIPEAVKTGNASLIKGLKLPTDPIKIWLEKGSFEDGHKAPSPTAKEVYEDYLDFVEGNDLPNPYKSQRAFNRALVSRGHHKSKGTGNVTIWTSLKKRD